MFDFFYLLNPIRFQVDSTWAYILDEEEISVGLNVRRKCQYKNFSVTPLSRKCVLGMHYLRNKENECNNYVHGAAQEVTVLVPQWLNHLVLGCCPYLDLAECNRGRTQC